MSNSCVHDHMNSGNKSSRKYKLVCSHSYKHDGPSDLSEGSQTYEIKLEYN